MNTRKIKTTQTGLKQYEDAVRFENSCERSPNWQQDYLKMRGEICNKDFQFQQ